MGDITLLTDNKNNLVEKKLGVCILVWNIDAPGGMGRQAWGLARELAKSGIKITIITSSFVEEIGLKDIPWQKYAKDGVYFYRIPIKQWKYISAITFFIVSLCLMILLRKEFDVIYGVQLYSNGAIASLAGKLLNKPVAIKIACGGYCGDIATFDKLPLGWLAKRFARWADVYVSLSRQIEGELVEAGFTNGEIVHIPNGVDANLFYPIKSREGKIELKRRLSIPDKKIVVFVGRLDSQKRIDLLIEVFTEVNRLLSQTHLIVIGEGSEKNKIQSMLNENITLVGVVNNVDAYLRASDLLVLPSLAEGMSNVILEAMATGLPVISTKVGSNPEVIDNGINGILLDIQDQTGFKENIIRVLTDGSLAEKMGQRAREKVVERFTIERVAADYLKLFVKMIHGGNT